MRMTVLVPFAVALTLATAGPSMTSAAPPALMSPRDLQALPSEKADVRNGYGSDPNQFGELRLPRGPGPHPLVILIHGGCFKAANATLRDLAPMADALKAQGIASWSLEYRRLGQPGAGWPGTYRDIAAGVDHVRSLASAYNLDLRRVVVVGHSAGGHLATWAAARRRLPPGSDLYVADPLPLAGVVNLAGPFDLRENIAAYEAECRDPVITEMMGGTPTQKPERYVQASAGALLPLGVPQALVWGEHEDFMPHGLARAYVGRATRSGDAARLHVVPDAGHFEIASPRTQAWPVVLAAVQEMLGRSGGAAPASAGTQAASTDDNAAIRAMGQAWATAWNARDARALAALFDADATFVSVLGPDTPGLGRGGRSAFEQAHAAMLHSPMFADSAWTTRQVDVIRFIRPDVAVAQVLWETTGDRVRHLSPGPRAGASSSGCSRSRPANGGSSPRRTPKRRPRKRRRTADGRLGRGTLWRWPHVNLRCRCARRHSDAPPRPLLDWSQSCRASRISRPIP